MEITLASLTDIKYIDSLRKQESNSIGFIPIQRYEMEITGERNGTILIIRENNDNVGFLYATHGTVSHIQQIAIQKDARLMERGKALIDKLQEISNQRNIRSMSCRCAQDLDSNHFWQALGFNLVGEVDSKSLLATGEEKFSKRKRLLNIYNRTQNGLWIPGDLGEYSIKRKDLIYPRTSANTGVYND